MSESEDEKKKFDEIINRIKRTMGSVTPESFLQFYKNWVEKDLNEINEEINETLDDLNIVQDI